MSTQVRPNQAGVNTADRNAELLRYLERVAIATERTSRRVLVIELFFLVPLTIAAGVAITLMLSR